MPCPMLDRFRYTLKIITRHTLVIWCLTNCYMRGNFCFCQTHMLRSLKHKFLYFALKSAMADFISFLSYLFNHKTEVIAKHVIYEGCKKKDPISKSLMTLLLEKTNDFQLVRKEFFQILTSCFDDCYAAIAYVKKYATDTSHYIKNHYLIWK